MQKLHTKAFVTPPSMAEKTLEVYYEESFICFCVNGVDCG